MKDTQYRPTSFLSDSSSKAAIVLIRRREKLWNILACRFVRCVTATCILQQNRLYMNGLDHSMIKCIRMLGVASKKHVAKIGMFVFIDDDS